MDGRVAGSCLGKVSSPSARSVEKQDQQNYISLLEHLLLVVGDEVATPTKVRREQRARSPEDNTQGNVHPIGVSGHKTEPRAARGANRTKVSLSEPPKPTREQRAISSSQKSAHDAEPRVAQPNYGTPARGSAPTKNKRPQTDRTALYSQRPAYISPTRKIQGLSVTAEKRDPRDYPDQPHFDSNSPQPQQQLTQGKGKGIAAGQRRMQMQTPNLTPNAGIGVTGVRPQSHQKVRGSNQRGAVEEGGLVVDAQSRQFPSFPSAIEEQLGSGSEESWRVRQWSPRC
jgi:hypothetical protein